MALVPQTRTGELAAEPGLSYVLSTDPSPLKVSPENTSQPHETGELLIVASRRDRAALDVEWIKVKVPAGTMSPDLAEDLSKVTARINLTEWTVRLNPSTNEFVFEPTGSYATIGADQGLTLQLSEIPINRKVGTSPITVTERSRTGNSAFQNSSTVFDVGKFPADFRMENFLCNPLVIDNGGKVTLTWQRSGAATFELLYNDANPDVTNVTTKDIHDIKADTTFYLRGTAGDPSNPVVRILSTQVTVRKPDLVVGKLTVTGESQFQHPITGPVNFAGQVNVTQGAVLAVDGDAVYRGKVSLFATRYRTEWSAGKVPNRDTPFRAKAPTDGFLRCELVMREKPLNASGETHLARLTVLANNRYRGWFTVPTTPVVWWDSHVDANTFAIRRDEEISCYVEDAGTATLALASLEINWCPLGGRAPLQVLANGGTPIED
ncbi:hypothetical protein [Streptomyces sp. NPDC059122]|uniref:hypothetical protein n=1 Tax=Streptomyces sp. NPDC059122 TaxID=3346732 RepID=UPI003686BA3C